MLRKLHRIVAIVFTPFLLITPITGIILLFRKTGLYGDETKNLLQGMHN
ncbi:MAG: PepSY domain-containing protein [Candidatus Brocadiales bacterium]|nr:PepSY domain-containing protein [Candidatus Bathyanammoxibius amoris]